MQNERGSVLVFVTLMITLLLVMVGMGLDTGHLAYVRSQGQPAVDAAALAAAGAVPTANWTTVTQQAMKFNPGGDNPGPGNDYVGSSNNTITEKNVTLVKYDHTTGAITTSGVTMANANGVRVALENSNPYGGTAGAAMKSPLFLTPLFNLLGQNTNTTADVSVSAVAAIRALPGLPIAVTSDLCEKPAETKKLDFQSGGKSNAGWETYHIQNASADQIRALWRALPSCSGQPIVDVGYCGYLQNGVVATVFNDILKKMFADNPDRCYLIPVVKEGGNFNQCQTIERWASFCPCTPAMPCPGDPPITDAFADGGQGKLYGKVTCGQDPWTSRDTQCYVPLLVRDTKSGM